jgi:hypothetical protein
MAEKREYTVRKHMLRVRRAIEQGLGEAFCPAAPHLDWNRDFNERWTNDPCSICSGFVGTYGCPCISLGEDEALKLTKVKLHLHGYPVRDQGGK